MDIASRIKMFLDTLGIPNSQFADTCGIPRPSLSQLLNGRNKKVSDEVIGKIHDAYPNLSVLWLMFGEGDMTVDGNIEISEPKNEFNPTSKEDENTEEQYFTPPISNLFDVENYEPSTFVAEKHVHNRKITDDTPLRQASYTKNQASELSLSVDNTRRVVSIMVLYSDKSFETFVPKGM